MADSHCVADGCMAWRFSWDTRDGFEEEGVDGLNWREVFGLEVEALGDYLARVCGPDVAAPLVARLNGGADDDDDDGDDTASLADDIDAALEEALNPKREDWAADHRPEGDGWGLKEVWTEAGMLRAVYIRSAMRRGGCGLARLG
jgi:hypothetical protein